jgi:hypothetical protein
VVGLQSRRNSEFGIRDVATFVTLDRSERLAPLGRSHGTSRTTTSLLASLCALSTTDPDLENPLACVASSPAHQLRPTVFRDGHENMSLFPSFTDVTRSHLAPGCPHRTPQGLHHNHLPLPYWKAANLPDHADMGTHHPPPAAVNERKVALQLRESHEFMAVPYARGPT